MLINNTLVIDQTVLGKNLTYKLLGTVANIGRKTCNIMKYAFHVAMTAEIVRLNRIISNSSFKILSLILTNANVKLAHIAQKITTRFILDGKFFLYMHYSILTNHCQVPFKINFTI